jgi:DNA-binding Lrp family transcriptional regulator
MTDETRRRILEEFRQFSVRPSLEPDEVTVTDYAEEYGCSHQLASQRLKQLVADGYMTMRRGIYDPRCGKVVNAYRAKQSS